MYKRIENVEEFQAFLSILTRKKMTLLVHMKNWISIKDLAEKVNMSPGDLNAEINLMEELELVKARYRKDDTTTYKEYKMDAVLIVNLYPMQL